MRTTLAWLLAALAAEPLLAQAKGSAELTIARALIVARSPATDDPIGLVGELCRVLEAHRDHPAALFLTREIERAVPDVEDLADLASRAQSLAKLDKVHPQVADSLRTLEFGIAERLGRTNRANELDAMAGHCSEWLAIGPFGDSGEVSTGVPFAPELSFPQPGQSSSGRYGPVQTRVVTRRTGRPLVRLEDPGSGQLGCFYGLVQVEALQPASGYAEVNTSGSFELFVNGRSRLRFERLGSRAGPVFRIPVSLRAGNNHLLLKTTLASATEIGMRLVDGTGRPLAGLTERKAKDGCKPFATAADEALLPGPFVTAKTVLESALRELAGEERKAVQIATALAAVAAQTEDEALPLVLQLEADPPSDVRARLALAQLVLDLEVLPQEVRRDRARRIAEPALASDQTHHSRMLKAVFQEDEDKREEAIRMLLPEAGKPSLAGPATWSKLVSLYRGLHFDAEVNTTLAAWRAAAPKSRRAKLEQARQKLDLHDSRGALTLVDQVLAESPGDERALNLVARLAAEQGDATKAEKAHDLVHVRDQGEPAELADRYELYQRLCRTAEALEVARKIAQHPSSSAARIARAGDGLLRAGNTQAAQEAYARALQRDPSMHATRATWEAIRGEPERAELAAFRRDADALLAAFQPSDREKTASTTLLLDQMIVRLYEDGSALEETHQLKRINDVRGGEQAQTAERPANADELVRIRTIARDGKSYVPSRVEGSFNMPRLEPGSFIEQHYRTFKPSPRPGPWRTTTFYFQSQDEPFVLSEFVLILPKDAPGALRMRRFSGSHEEQELPGGLIAHVFRAHDVPRLPTEKHLPPVDDMLPLVTYGEDGDAGADSRSLRAVILARSRTSSLVEAEANRLVAGISADTEKARAIHTFVHEAILDAGGSADPTTILLLKKGPRFFLELAMLRAVDIPLELAACAAQRRDLLSPSAPLWSGEGDLQMPAIMLLPRDGSPAWIFADDPRHAPLGFVAVERDGAAAEILLEGESIRTTVRSDRPTRSGLAIRGAMTLDKQGLGKLDVTLAVRGSEGLHAAEQVRNLEENVQQLAGRQIAGEMFPGWSLKTIDLGDVKKKGEPLTAKATLTKRGAVRPAGDFALLATPIPPFHFLQTLGDRLPRALPFEWSELVESDWEITLDLGESWTCTDLPASVHWRHPLLDYDLSFTRANDEVRVRRSVRVFPGRIDASGFTEWVSLLRSLDLVEERNLKVMPR